MTERRYFTPELFKFLRELGRNNNREWFAANKERYETHLREPFLDFIEDFGPRLEEISRHFIADPRPVGGSMTRIHRDIRFSKDKSPYKTMTMAHFRHDAGKDVHAPGFYLHLEPGGVHSGGGLWHPDPKSLAQVREAIASRPDDWTRVTTGAAFDGTLVLWGEQLKRPPSGYAPDHPLVEDLKRKDFVAMASLSEDEVCAPGFLDRYTDICRGAAPLVSFLTGALGLEF